MDLPSVAFTVVSGKEATIVSIWGPLSTLSSGNLKNPQLLSLMGPSDRVSVDVNEIPKGSTANKESLYSCHSFKI